MYSYMTKKNTVKMSLHHLPACMDVREKNQNWDEVGLNTLGDNNACLVYLKYQLYQFHITLKN